MIDSKKLENEILTSVNSVSNQDSLEEIRIAELGKKGRISLLMKELSNLSNEEKKENGSKLNNLKNTISNSISKNISSIF